LKPASRREGSGMVHISRTVASKGGANAKKGLVSSFVPVGGNRKVLNNYYPLKKKKKPERKRRARTKVTY